LRVSDPQSGDRLEADRIIGTEPIPASQRRPRSAALLLAAARTEAHGK
jgi:hypothetical protein